MKKILATLALAAMAASVQAASIDWSLSGMNKVLTEYDGTTVAKYTKVYLILADNTSLAKITYDTTTEKPTKDEFDTALSTILIANVEAGEDGKKPATTKITVESDLLAAGTSYSLAAIYLSESEGSGYYRIVKTSGTAYDPSVAGSSGSVSTSWQTLSGSSWTKGYTAVPEPSTAVLALAGLALLLKRRRA